MLEGTVFLGDMWRNCSGLDLEYEVLNVWHVEPGAVSHHPDILTRLKYLLYKMLKFRLSDSRRHTVHIQQLRVFVHSASCLVSCSHALNLSYCKITFLSSTVTTLNHRSCHLILEPPQASRLRSCVSTLPSHLGTRAPKSMPSMSSAPFTSPGLVLFSFILPFS